MKVIYTSRSLYYDYIQFTSSKNFTSFDLKLVPKSLIKVFNFIKDVSNKSKLKITEWIEILKDSTIFKFFEKCKFNLKKVYDLIFGTYTKEVKMVLNEISKYIEDTKVSKWTNSELRKLDSYLKKNPKIKKVAGLALAAFLIYMNLHVTYTGDFSFDFDMSSIADALKGNYSLSDVLGGPNGISLLVLFTTNLIGLSFPWNTPIKLIGILGNTLIKLVKDENKNHK